jgi:hypothetical protein
VHERRRAGARLNHIDHRGQLVVLDMDLGRDVFGLGARGTHAHRNRFAHVPHFVFRERPQIGRLETLQARDGADRPDAHEVLHDPHAILHALRFLDGHDARVRDRRAHECHLEHAGAAYVSDELAAAGKKARVLLPRKRSADTLA